MKQIEKNSIFLSLAIAVVVMLLLCSCGLRKVDKSNTKETEQTEVKTTSETQTKVNDNTKIVDTSTSDEVEFIPIDNTKPIIVNGKSYFNVHLKHRSIKYNISTAKSIIIAKNNVKSSNLSYNKVKVVEIKQIERKQSYYWLLWFLLLIPIYLLWQKYRNII